MLLGAMTDKDVEHHGAGGVHGKVEHAAEVLEVTEVDQTYEQVSLSRDAIMKFVPPPRTC